MPKEAEKRVLFVSHTANFHKFNRPLMQMLRGKLKGPYAKLNIGNCVVDYASANEEKVFDADHVYQIDFVRSPFRLKQNLRAYKQLRDLLNTEHYDLIHTHTPMGSVLTRLAARKQRKNGKTRVIYTAHGFHFYKGAPMLNWLVYYPVEKYLAKDADLLITINHEDFLRAKTRFGVPVKMIDGVGVDMRALKSIKLTKAEKAAKRKALSVDKKTKLIICSAEFTKNKNQRLILTALAKVKQKRNDFCMLFCGVGRELANCKTLAKTLGLEENVRFLGYRKDNKEMTVMANLAINASKREGLCMAGLEQIALACPVLFSNNRGIREMLRNEKNKAVLFNPKNATELAQKILSALEKPNLYTIKFDERFSLKNSLSKIRKIYLSMLEDNA